MTKKAEYHMKLRTSCPCCTSRRGFIGNLAAFGASAFVAAGRTRADAPARIDVHHHIFPREVLDLQEKLNPVWGHLKPPPSLKQWTPAVMIEALDRDGVAAAITSSPSPGAWFGNVEGARTIMRAWNDNAASLVRDHRSRVGFFAMMAPPDVDGSLKEVEYALDTLHADGIGLHSNYEGKFLGDPAFAPFFDELNRRKAVVYVHPALSPCCGSVQPGIRTNLLEFPFDTTRTIVSLLYSGTLSRCPDIRFIFSHGGGTLPMLAGRIDLLGNEYKGLKDKIPDGIPATLKRLYTDTAGTTTAASINATISVTSASHLLYGTDFPYLTIADANSGLAAAGLSDERMRAIARDNALALFPRFKT
jgi:predicted TIM-barrel fold metal-dependent hydrolase